MSRPSTDWPITRVSITGDGTVVVVDVDVDVGTVVVDVDDVDDVVSVVVDGDVGVGAIDAAVVIAGVAPLGLGAVEGVAVPSDEHPNSTGATKKVNQNERRQRTGEQSVERDDDTARVARLHHHLRRVGEPLCFSRTAGRPEPDLAALDRHCPGGGGDRCAVALERGDCDVLLIGKCHWPSLTGCFRPLRSSR